MNHLTFQYKLPKLLIFFLTELVFFLSLFKESMINDTTNSSSGHLDKTISLLDKINVLGFDYLPDN